MSNKTRISAIKEAPFSWKEKDLLTAAEGYMKGAMEFSLIEFSLPCFPELEDKLAAKVSQVWRCMAATLHLQKINTEKGDSCIVVQQKAGRLYELEAQRILGGIFPYEHKFWEAFYSRQELEETKPLVAIDALHFITSCQEQIAYQLLIQSLKAIIKGHYVFNGAKKKHFQNAKRLIIDLPVIPMQSWLNHQLI